MEVVRQVHVDSSDVRYTDDCIEARYRYQSVEVQHDSTGTGSSDDSKQKSDASSNWGPTLKAVPRETVYTFRTERKVPRLGVMLVGWGGNNGSTVTATALANKLGLEWNTKEGLQKANYYGSITQASTIPIGNDGPTIVHAPLYALLPMVNPNDIIFDGWDISSLNLADAMERARVLDYHLQKQLRKHMEPLKPRRSIYYKDFIAANQSDRADNILDGDDKWQHLEQLRQDIRDFRNSNSLNEVIILWTANTERFCEIREGLNDTADNLLESIKRSDPEVSPSTLFAVAAALEGCSYINGSPQNTFVPGAIELAERQRTFIGGDDFKSGQTKFKSVVVDFLVSAGIKPTSIVSYNHLGNNDGKNLSAPEQFRSKEISKSNVVDDMVESNSLLYAPGESPDHCVVIKYVPQVGDSKRAMDEYVSEIAMGGRQTIVVHNTCEDSLLAGPIIFDLIVLTELFQRITFRLDGEEHFQRFNAVLSILSYLCKAPIVPRGTPLVNSLFRQRACIENVLRACAGLPPINHMLLEYKHEKLVSQTNSDARRASKEVSFGGNAHEKRKQQADKGSSGTNGVLAHKTNGIHHLAEGYRRTEDGDEGGKINGGHASEFRRAEEGGDFIKTNGHQTNGCEKGVVKCCKKAIANGEETNDNKSHVTTNGKA